MEAKAESERKLVEEYNLQSQGEEVKKPKLHQEEAKGPPASQKQIEIEKRPEVTFPSGDKYAGQWIKGTQIQQGRGFMQWADGSRYLGEFQNNKIHGKGKVVFSNEDWYQGSFVKGKKSGYGKYVFVDGRSYLGDWLNDKQHGEGTFTYADGSTCTGIWSENQFMN